MKTVQLRRLTESACDGPFGSAIKTDHYAETGARVVRLGNIGSAEWNERDEAFIDLTYFDQLKRHEVLAGDLLIAGLGDDRNPVGRASVAPQGIYPAIVKADCYRFRLRDCDARFFAYYLSSEAGIAQSAQLADGSTRKRLTLGKALALRVPHLELTEQRAIADYLDTETARIDALITKKQQLIHLLEERSRLAGEGVIARLRELNRLVPLKYVVRESDLRWGSASAEPLVLSVSIHHGVVPRSVVSDKESRADNFSNYKVCVPGQIAINRMRAFQGGVGVVRETGVVSPDYTVLDLDECLDSDFIHFLMRSDWFVSEMTRRLRGIGATDQGAVRTPRVNFADLGEIEIPVPAKQQQQEIASSLRADRSASLAPARLLARQSALLSERRSALISGAVTGEHKLLGVV